MALSVGQVVFVGVFCGKSSLINKPFSVRTTFSVTTKSSVQNSLGKGPSHLSQSTLTPSVAMVCFGSVDTIYIYFFLFNFFLFFF